MIFNARRGTLTAVEVAQLEDLGYQVVWQGEETIRAPVAQEEDVSWIEDIYETVDAALGGWLPGGAPLGSNLPMQVMNQPIYANTPVQVPLPGPAQVAIPAYTGTGCDDDPMKGMVWKKHCGTWRWVKVKRRRRRKLVSQSDAQGLSTLIAILGNGKATQAWIATHT